ncbi:MAG: endolytic transglycosylase MltG [Halobacteriovoraceae bacterium]|nr:endolytic transglycosylase MltG [Halobacteriovoraceae bacterium]
MTKFRLLLFLVIAPILGVLLASFQIYYKIQVWSYNGPDIVFEVEKGETFGRINYRLGQQNLISSTKIFHRYAQFNGIMTSFKTGKFKIKTGSNMIDVVRILTKGTSIGNLITIPEGQNMYQIGDILESNRITSKKDFVSFCKDPQVLAKYSIEGPSVEGFLYPDTYQFEENTHAKIVIGTMIDHFFDKTKNLDFSILSLNKFQVITLASIVEKETGAPWERSLIAGVFHNRLKKRMRLQSDPTTIYGIWHRYKGNLTKNDLLQKTEYNTYKISGLPKGPISNPGLDAIEAVLNPKDHEFLYFVSQNDGTHIFSKTYKDHNRAVTKFQKTRENREGRSWRELSKKLGSDKVSGFDEEKNLE